MSRIARACSLQLCVISLASGCLFRADLRDQRLAELTDDDNDGFSAAEDCDDNDPQENPDVVWFADADGDTYGDPTSFSACERTVATDVLNNADCDDQDDREFPGQLFYVDNDNDSYGSDAQVVSCSRGEVGDWAEDNTDCNDNDPSIHPDAEETCDNAIDDNCDGLPNGCDAAGANDAEDAHLLLVGNNNAQVGSSVSTAGDVNADGYQDLWVGAGGIDTVYLVHGGAGVLGERKLSELAALRLDGAEGAYTGGAIAQAGDVDGDGVDDLLVGGADPYTTGGRAYLISGPVTADMDLESGARTIIKANSIVGFARSITSAGDVNQDGFDDVLVGSYEGAFLYLGPSSEPSRNANGADATFGTGGNNLEPGTDVASGDVNADGVPDLIIGSPGTASTFFGEVPGEVQVFFGPWSSQSVDIDDADLTMIGADWDRAGSAVACDGDHDGDGADDILVGAPEYEGGEGRAYLVLGRHSGQLNLADADATLVGATDFNRDLGIDVGTANDVNRDGEDDFWVLERGFLVGGRAQVVLGPISGQIDLATEAHETWSTDPHWCDAQGAGLGDFNGDGADDFAVGHGCNTADNGAFVVLATTW